MKLIRRTKVHHTKEGKEFKKVHFYIRVELNSKEVDFEVEPVVFKDKKGNLNKYAQDLAFIFSTKED